MTREQVLQSVQPAYAKKETPYHIELEYAVDAILEAHILGYPLDFDWLERNRDNLSRVLDKMKEKA